MKAVLLGALIGAGLVLLAAGASPGGNEEVFPRAGVAPSVQAGGDLITVSTVVGDKYQQLTVIDPKQMVMSVYHVQLATGSVQLRCVRNLHWDLRMTEFNGESPLPREVQSLVKPR